MTTHHKHSLSQGIVLSLRKFAVALKRSGKSEIHLRHCALTQKQQDNFQKLQYWGLVYRNSQKSIIWSLTDKGRNFLRGTQAVAKSVIIYSDSRIEEDSTRIRISDIDIEPFYYNRQHYAETTIHE